MSEARIHGYPIVARAPGNRAGWEIILVERGPESFHPYVTATWETGAGEWIWGHYFESLEEAKRDFAERVTRGY
jgi:hypothetical protein